MLGRIFESKNADASKNFKLKTSWIVWGICAAALILVAILSATANPRKTIDLNKYLKMEVSGYDGYGTVQAYIDWMAIEAQYGDKLSFTKKARIDYGERLSTMSPIEIIEDGVTIEFDKYSGLLNGDSLSYKWIIDNKLSGRVNCELKYKDGVLKVSQLEKAETFDAFADLDVHFSGFAPSGKAEIVYSGSELNAADFSCDKTSGLRNGDIVTVTLFTSEMNYYAEKLGKIPEITSKTFQVSGLEEFISNYSDLTDDFITNIRSEAEDTISSYAAKKYGKQLSLNNLEYSGYVLNSIKDGTGDITQYNILYIIYKGEVASTTNAFSSVEILFPVKFINILKDADGNISYGSKDGISGMTYIDGHNYSTSGFEEPLSCYKQIIDEYKHTYNSECGDGFEGYSNVKIIEHLSDIEDSYKEIIYADAKERIKKYITSEDNVDSTAENLSVIGEYLLVARSQGELLRQNNAYIVVFKADVSDKHDTFEPTTVYFPVEYKGIIQFPNGEYEVDTKWGLIGSTNMPNSWFSMKGYTDETVMYSEIITDRLYGYTYEISEGLKDFRGNAGINVNN